MEIVIIYIQKRNLHPLLWYLFTHVLVTNMGFGLVIGFIGHLQLITTVNYNTINKFHA
jgi:NhaP-type Na+/H+ and K+/H+ antiporter